MEAARGLPSVMSTVEALAAPERETTAMAVSNAVLNMECSSRRKKTAAEYPFFIVVGKKKMQHN